MVDMLELPIEEKKAMLNGRLQQIARNYYDSSVDLAMAKAINDSKQITVIQNRLNQWDISYNAVQSLLDELNSSSTIV
jgi:hypothetical protein